MADLTFLKLGGSLLTDKTRTEAIRHDVLKRLANELAEARYRREEFQLVLGHGSGSFGHVAAAKFNTRFGVSGPEQWAGFAEVSDAAARLNRYVVAVLLEAGIPAISLSPSASAVCHDGRLVHLASEPIRAALDSGLVPVVYGDVAFDSVRGGTIISTEEILDFLAHLLKPQRLLLAGETPGVLDRKGMVVPLITPPMLPELWPILGGSRGTDVTGGMSSKVESMLSLVADQNELVVYIFSGLEPGILASILVDPRSNVGTQLRNS
jgi:isopentenyl phosphate kinase